MVVADRRRGDRSSGSSLLSPKEWLAGMNADLIAIPEGLLQGRLEGQSPTGLPGYRERLHTERGARRRAVSGHAAGYVGRCKSPFAGRSVEAAPRRRGLQPAEPGAC